MFIITIYLSLWSDLGAFIDGDLTISKYIFRIVITAIV